MRTKRSLAKVIDDFLFHDKYETAAEITVGVIFVCVGMALLYVILR